VVLASVAGSVAGFYSAPKGTLGGVAGNVSGVNLAYAAVAVGVFVCLASGVAGFSGGDSGGASVVIAGLHVSVSGG
jgi:hypothetical protein